ncbi:MAG: hypothetical protein D6776_04140 [Planctomycetota bacterium]|nr:MAG: hypothetical protein D6776_04140 [Planctomycetota bacterium]
MQGKWVGRCRALAFGVLLTVGTGIAHAAGDAERPIRTDRDGVYEAGPWRYTLRITNRGTRSQGTHGTLFYAGREVPEPAHRNDYYVTPFGKLYWVGDPPLLFGAHGWMPKPRPSDPVGTQLPDPATLARRRFEVRLAVLAPGGDGDKLPDGWIQTTLERVGAPTTLQRGPWRTLGSSWLVVHDSRHYGWFRLRRGKDGPWHAPVLEVEYSGSLETLGRRPETADLLRPSPPGGEPARMALPPQPGAHRLLHWKSDSRFGPFERYVAIEVRAVPTGGADNAR